MVANRTIPILAAGLLAFAACAPAAPVADAPDPTARAASPPQPLEARPLSFPEFEEFTLPNGLQVIFVEHRSQPVASVNLYVRSGTAADPAERAGLADLASELLDKGTENRTALQIAEEIAAVGGSLSASADTDYLYLSSTLLADDLPVAFDLLSDVALRPVFPEDELALARRRTLSGLQAALGQPQEIARRRFDQEVYGEGHPYGINPVPGTVEAVTRDDLVRFHRDGFRPDNALLVVSGAVSRADAERLAREHFGEWEPGAPAARTFPAPPARGETEIHLVHRPGSVQSNIRIGHIGIRPDTPDLFPLLVMNRILGGGADARLFQILREEKGWTYGAYSRMSRPADVGVFSAFAEVRTEVTDSAVAEIMHQLHRLRDEEIPSVDFQAAVDYLAGSFPLSLQTPGQIAGQVARSRLLGEPIEYVTEYPERIRAVTPEDVRRVAREYVRPDRAAIIVVGDATEVLATLEGIAPIRLYDVEGAPITRADLERTAEVPSIDATRLTPGTLRYAFMVQGNSMGDFVQELRREGGTWVSAGSMASPVMQMDSEVVFTDDFTPIRSQQSMAQGGATISSDLRIEDGRLVGQADMPEAAGGARTYDQAAPAGLLLPGMDAYALALADLEEGSSLTFPMFNSSEGAVRPVTFHVRDIQTVEVPAGTFESYRVQMEGGDMPMTLFLRREAPHITVKQEFDGQPVSIELQAID